MKKNIKLEDNTPKFIGGSNALVFNSPIVHSRTYYDFEFTFLNLSKKFENRIDWNFEDYGKLWTYNLNYFDFLFQKDISIATGVSFIKDYIGNYSILKDGKESAPTAIRMVNWIKFIIGNKIFDEEINECIWIDTHRLSSNLEFHLLGNHLLENAFGLLFSSYFFKNEEIYQKAKKLLITQLNEQILNDGAHFELSPMYHKLILYRTLDAINLIRGNKWKEDVLYELLVSKASVMIAWLNQICFSNGELPLLNDSALNIYPTPKELFNYTEWLGLPKSSIELKECGYRKINNSKFELIVDIGQLGPSYQPGHAHADTFNFLLNIAGQKVIVDTGISTYNVNEKRLKERSTSAHNTVTVNGEDSSKVWGGFRVGKRAKIVKLEEAYQSISASHDGFKKLGVVHKRNFIWSEDQITIIDSFNKQIKGKAHFHFHKDVVLKRISDIEFSFENSKIIFYNAINSKIESFEYAEEFNKLTVSKKIIVEFENSLTTKLNID